jgi:hypothetical protein
MKSSRITRYEFHNWLCSRNINPLEIYKNPDETEKQLKQMAVEMLTVDAALSEKFDITPFYYNINRAVYANFLSSYYKSEIQNDLVYNESAVEIKQIKLYFPKDLSNSDDREVYRDKLTLAGYIIQKDKSGFSFDKLRLKYSEENMNSSMVKSEIIPLVFLESSIREKIKNLQDGCCVQEPVVLQNAVVVIKLIRWLTLTEKNAEKMINNNEVYNRFLERISEGVVEYIIAENGTDMNIVSNIGSAYFKNSKELLFSINGRCFTTGEFEELLGLFIFLNPANKFNDLKTIEKRGIAFNILNEHILSYIAEKKGIVDSKDFGDRWEFIKKSTLAGTYKCYILSGGKNDNKAFSRENSKKLYEGTESRDVKSDYTHAEKKIITKSSSRKYSNIETKKNAWENRLLDANNFIIYRDELY